MSEASHGIDIPPQQNKVADYVISTVRSYDELNAPRLVEGDIKFREALKLATLKSGAGRAVGVGGGDFLVNQLADNDDIVVKRLRTVDPDYDPKEYWEGVQKEHKIVEKYFGRRFVPYTEFITVDTSLGETEEKEGVLPGKEYVVIQERLFGEEYSLNTQGLLYPPVSRKFKGELVEFIKRYEKMMREEKATIDDQIMIDFTEETVKIHDTNNLMSFEDLLDTNDSETSYFLNAVGVDPELVHNSDDIMRALFESLPDEYADLHGEDFYTALDTMQTPEFKQALLRKYPPSEGHNITNGFIRFIDTIDSFPPSSYHSVYIHKLMEDFKVTDLDLAA